MAWVGVLYHESYNLRIEENKSYNLSYVNDQ